MSTIKDVAKEAGVSISTVSRVLNKKHVKQQNYEAVMRAIEKFSYKVNNNAQNISTKNTKTIGIMVPTLNYPYFMHIAKHTQKRLKESGYSILLVDNDSDSKTELEELQQLINDNVDGIVVCSATETSWPILKEIAENIPVVLVHSMMEDEGVFDIVNFDGTSAVYTAMQECIKNGHKRVGIIGCDLNYAGQERIKGYLRVLEDYRVPFREELVKVVEAYDSELGYRAANEFLDMEMKERPTLIFASNYDFSRGTIRAINERGLKIPDDISFVGYDIEELLEFYIPKLTMIFEDFEKTGKTIADLILRTLKNDRKYLPEMIRIKSMLVMGNSISKIN